jgi:hypothetical protein
VFLRPSGHAETDLSGERVHAPVVEPAAGQDEDDEDPPADDDVAEEAARFLALEAKARRQPANVEDRRKFEKRLRQGLEEYFAGQLERIEAAVGEQYQPVAHTNGNGTADE